MSFGVAVIKTTDDVISNCLQRHLVEYLATFQPVCKSGPRQLFLHAVMLLFCKANPKISISKVYIVISIT